MIHTPITDPPILLKKGAKTKAQGWPRGSEGEGCFSSDHSLRIEGGRDTLTKEEMPLKSRMIKLLLAPPRGECPEMRTPPWSS
ncbi:hypothetical protein NPIL_552391 [Nephila pilipes]|uniref:Uncharacterized protein n=1 Tax=Nephila pilipes TaxID=299642 RepID=A0A8X6Q7P9_NEPPI|nr:hypothetical protein NPIL_552391 [Nephila pilipes]